MPGGMAPLKKPRNRTKLPLALNPMKSKDVLAVLAERNQAIVPVGAWVEPASPNCSEIPAHTSAYMIEKEIKEQQWRKQESLKHFQRQVKHRVNQQVKLRKKQQLQKSYRAAEKEGSIAMQCPDSTLLTQKTSVFPCNLNAAIGSCRLPPSQVLGDAKEDEENQIQLFQQQAQALSQTMKQARHQLASFKTVSEKKASVFLNGRRKSSPTQEDFGCGEISSLVTGKKERENLIGGYQQGLLPEDKEKTVNKAQKVKFKHPLFVVIKEDEQKQLNLHSLQAILPAAQGYLVEVQGNCPESQSDVIDVLNVEPKALSIESKAPGVGPNTQATGTEFKTTETEGQTPMTEFEDILKSQTVVLDGNIVLETQDFLPPSQTFLSRDQDFLPKCHDQDSLLKDHHILPKSWNVLPECQDQHFLPGDQELLPRNQLTLPEEQSHPLKCQNQDLPPKEQSFLPRHQYILPTYQDRRGPHVLPKCQDHDVLSKDQNNLHKCQEQDLPLQNQEVNFKEPFSDTTDGKGKEIFSLDMFIKKPSILMKGERESEELPLECYQYLPPQIQDQFFLREQCRSYEQASDKRWKRELYSECYGCCLHEIQDPGSASKQSLHFRQQPSLNTAEKWEDDLHLGGHEHLSPRRQRDTCSRQQQGYEEYRSDLSTEYQALLAFQSGVDQEEDKKERQKQYLRHRRLFMDIEREQVKEQNRQREQKKRIERIKKRKEQQRYAEEQKLLKMNCREEPCSEEKIGDALAHLQLEEIKGAREKQYQREKEYIRIKKRKEQQRYAEEQKLLKMNCREEPCSEEKIGDALAHLQLEEIKGAREKQYQREKEYIRYVEALRAQVQEKMKLYNITLPPLCCCGPDFWDAHPDTCANNCIFYKNYRAYNRALHSVINSSDISEGNATLRNAIRNFASVHRRTSKKDLQ